MIAPLSTSIERLWYLANAVCNGEASDDELRELETLLMADELNRCRYLAYCRMHAALVLEAQAQCAGHIANKTTEHAVVAPITSQHLPPLSFLTTAYHGTVGFFAQEVPFSILIATLVFALGGIIGSVMTVHHYTQFAGQSKPSYERSFAAADAADKARASAKEKEKDVQWVGRITGMVDCKWSDDKDFLPPGGSYVSLGRRYKLDAGLMEITYDTGAKVILQGPVTYEVESVNGGYMSLGKLTGKVEVEKAKGFCIRTPTALITDLGTEFDVEVKPDKATNVCVFRGVVETQRDSRSGGTPVRERLAAGEAIRYVSGGAPPRRTTVNALRAAPLPSLQTISAAAKEARRSFLLKPKGLLASACHRVWDANGKLLADNDRQLAFKMATDDFFGRGEKDEGPRSSFDTLDTGSVAALDRQPAFPMTADAVIGREGENTGRQGVFGIFKSSGVETNFVGLHYGDRVRIDRIKVFLGHQFGNGGSWREPPRVFILKTPADPGGAPPESDPANWREMPPFQVSYGQGFDAHADPNPGQVFEFALTNFSEKDRTGYGWAVGGVQGDGQAGYVSITELRGYGAKLRDKDAMIGHRD